MTCPQASGPAPLTTASLSDMISTSGNPVEAFYDYMEDRQLEELAIRKARKKESIEDMLEYLDGDSLKSIMRELLS